MGRMSTGQPEGVMFHDQRFSLLTSWHVSRCRSTGRPKGVMIAHHSIVNLLMATQANYQLRATDRFLQQSSISFDMTLVEIWLPLAIGACIVPAAARAQQDAPKLLQQVSDAKISVAGLVPSELTMWLEAGLSQKSAPNMRVLMTGGEALTPALAARTYAELPQATLIQMYGPTEVSQSALLCYSFFVVLLLLMSSDTTSDGGQGSFFCPFFFGRLKLSGFASITCAVIHNVKLRPSIL